MKWIGILQFFDEMPENLPRAVASMRRICHEVVGYDDGSTDGSRGWALDNLDCVFWSNSNDWKDEIRHKSWMLEEARGRGAEWVLWLDADEELSWPAVRAIHRLVESDPTLTGICVPEINLWRSYDRYRVDAGFGDAGFLRCWRMRPELRYDVVGRGLHLAQFPPAARERLASLRYPDEPILHHSWDSPEKIVAKYDRYRAQGQDGWNLERLRDIPEAVLRPVDPAWFRDDGEPASRNRPAQVLAERLAAS